MSPRLYASAARSYLAAGYSPLPLPPGQKWPPPKGWTGAGAPMTDLDQVRQWARSDPAGNIALRLPDDVIGIDLDLYPDPSKDHPAVERMAAWDALTGQLGPLPSRRGPPAATTASAASAFTACPPAGRAPGSCLPPRSARATRSWAGARPGPATWSVPAR